MNVSRTPELGEFIASRIASVRYRSASEVVRGALRLLQERESARAVARQSPGRIEREEPEAGGR